MPVRTSYEQGTPNWVDLQTTDQSAAKAFYSGLFGWTYDDQPMSDDADDADDAVYSMAQLGGQQVAAIAPQPPELAAAGAPPMWNTYLATDSVDDAVRTTQEGAGRPVDAAPVRLGADGGVGASCFGELWADGSGCRAGVGEAQYCGVRR